ncbi:MAG: phosphodiesterase [Rhodospirillales bacterium]|nr:phosphodiesterase [Rhodospirillales bacterium]
MNEADHPHNLQLQDAVARINSMKQRPDAVAITGDINGGDDLTPYDQAAIILGKLEMPFYVIPGNHDDRDALRQTFDQRGYMQDNFIQYGISHHDVRIIALDTAVTGESYGHLCEERLRWLSIKLAEDYESPTVIIMHHPPYESGILSMDGTRCYEGDALAPILKQSPNIERVMCGHLHRPTFAWFGGTIAGTCPSTAFHVAADLLNPEENLPHAEEDNPAFQLHYWSGSRMVTHQVSVAKRN